ncbi:MAG: methyltransferase family protein, partial [Candidatus Bathyarchaeia archaeon]
LMLPALVVAVFQAICLTVFVSVSLYNLKRSAASKDGVRFEAEVERPSGIFVVFAFFGTAAFFLETVLYILLTFVGFETLMSDSVLQICFPFDSWVQLAGSVLIAFAYALFVWSILARGRYATSWSMPEDQKLVTWGPYRYVRHPSYLAYFILFVGLFLTLLNWIAVLSFIAIPGYVQLVALEEKLLTKRFGEAYREYQRTTGKFFPKIKQRARL